MRLDTVRQVYFVGVGGIGMSALARYYKAQGCFVAGYDKVQTSLTLELEQEGIRVHYKEDVSLVKQLLEHPNWISDTLVVYTPAVFSVHAELEYLRSEGCTVLKRSELLGLITENTFTIAVAGTHGKTTTSTMIAHLLRHAGIDLTAFLGGISSNYNTNLLLGKDRSSKAIVVVEADEYDRSFLTLSPDISVITSMDADHLDIYGNASSMVESYIDFAKRLKDGGVLFSRFGLSPGLPFISYAVENKEAIYRAENIRIQDHQYTFDLHTPDIVIAGITSGLPGLHNIENAVAAAAVALKMGVTPDLIRSGISSFHGVRRRFDLRYSNGGLTYIDDYAHHPEELRACISSVRAMYPGQKITGVFQPHLFSRTRDFASGFSKSLSLLDEVLLLAIYPARELPIPGVVSEMLLEKITAPYKAVKSRAEVMDIIASMQEGVILTLGAGDIDQLVEPIVNVLQDQ